VRVSLEITGRGAIEYILRRGGLVADCSSGEGEFEVNMSSNQ